MSNFYVKANIPQITLICHWIMLYFQEHSEQVVMVWQWNQSITFVWSFFLSFGLLSFPSFFELPFLFLCSTASRVSLLYSSNRFVNILISLFVLKWVNSLLLCSLLLSLCVKGVKEIEWLVVVYIGTFNCVIFKDLLLVSPWRR